MFPPHLLHLPPRTAVSRHRSRASWPRERWMSHLGSLHGQWREIGPPTFDLPPQTLELSGHGLALSTSHSFSASCLQASESHSSRFIACGKHIITNSPVIASPGFLGVQKCLAAQCKPEVMGTMMLTSRDHLLEQKKRAPSLAWHKLLHYFLLPILHQHLYTLKACNPPKRNSKKEVMVHGVGLAG